MSHHLLAKNGITDPESRKRKASGENDNEMQPAPKKASPVAPKLGAFLASAPKSAEKITSLVVQMLIDDLLPIRTVEHRGFCELLKYLAPTDTILCRRSISSHLHTKHGELVQKAICPFESSNVYGVGLTADMWTSLATEGFIGVTAHFIDPSWEMRSVLPRSKWKKATQESTLQSG